MSIKSIIGVTCACACLSTVSINANAAVIFSDLGSGNYGVSLDLITFTVTTDQSAGDSMVIEDFFGEGAFANGIDVSGNINWSINGGDSVAINLNSHSGVLNNDIGQVDNNDLFFNYATNYFAAGGTSISAGDTVALWTDNMIFLSSVELTAPPPGSLFTAHLLNSGDNELISIANTSISSVPVPAAVWLFGSGLIGLIAVARRKKA